MSHISNGQGYTYGVRTLANTPTSGMQAGDTFYCSDHFRVFTYDGSLWTCDDTVVMRNRDTVTIPQWDLVSVQVGGTATEISCVRTSVLQEEKIVGVAVFSAAVGANCVIAIKGNWKVNTSGTIGLGALLVAAGSGGAAGKCSEYTGATPYGVFGFATSSVVGAGNISCILNSNVELN